MLPQPTLRARNRYRSRISDGDSPPLMAAFAEAETLSPPYQAWHADEVRYHRKLEAIFIVRERHLITTIDATDSRQRTALAVRGELSGGKA